MLILIENGEVYAPEPIGEQTVFVAGERIERIDHVDRRALDKAGLEYEYVDASDCVITPGLVDPHAHLLGGSGEGSIALQSPEMFVHEIAGWGITSVVGALGVDTTMKTISGLLARVKAMGEMGLSAWMWSGGYNTPPTTILQGVREDMMYISEVVGCGELAISDDRGLNQSTNEIARIVRDTHVGGLLSGKAGLTHFHVGEEKTRLQPLRDVIEKYQVCHEWLYPTHVQRDEELMKEAIDLAKKGSFVDFDVVDEDAYPKLRWYLEHDGPANRLTFSSDMDSSTPKLLYQQFCAMVVQQGLALEDVLPFFSTNAAAALKLPRKGRLAKDMDADMLVLGANGLDIRHVIARGRFMVRDGEVVVREKWLGESKRDIHLTGDEYR